MDDFVVDDEMGSESDYSEDDKPVKKKAPAKRKAAAAEADSQGEQPAKPAKKKREPTIQVPEDMDDELGFFLRGYGGQAPSMIWKEYGECEPSDKIAAFDLDGT